MVVVGRELARVSIFVNPPLYAQKNAKINQS